jgi:hypothetical protein
MIKQIMKKLAHCMLDGDGDLEQMMGNHDIVEEYGPNKVFAHDVFMDVRHVDEVAIMEGRGFSGMPKSQATAELEQVSSEDSTGKLGNNVLYAPSPIPAQQKYDHNDLRRPGAGNLFGRYAVKSAHQISDEITQRLRQKLLETHDARAVLRHGDGGATQMRRDALMYDQHVYTEKQGQPRRNNFMSTPQGFGTLRFKGTSKLRKVTSTKALTTSKAATTSTKALTLIKPKPGWDWSGIMKKVTRAAKWGVLMLFSYFIAPLLWAAIVWVVAHLTIPLLWILLAATMAYGLVKATHSLKSAMDLAWCKIVKCHKHRGKAWVDMMVKMWGGDD